MSLAYDVSDRHLTLAARLDGLIDRLREALQRAAD